MASLQSRLSSLITAIGADIKALQARTPTILTSIGGLSNTSEPTNAVEWWRLGTLIGKITAGVPTENSTIPNRGDIWIRARSRNGDVSVDRLLLNSDGLTTLSPPLVTSLPTTGPGVNAALVDGQECYFVADTGGTYGGPVVWHLKYRSADSKWYYVGGGALVANVNAFETIAATTTGQYADAPTTGPEIAVPLSGDYIIEYGAFADAATPDGSGQAMMVVRYSGSTGTAPSLFTREIRWRSTNWNTGYKYEKVTGIVAGRVFRCLYGNNNAANRVGDRIMKVTPIRVS
jgi:hypothetical protein